MDGARKEKKWGASPAIPSTSIQFDSVNSTKLYLIKK
jgi:hypothetical protein